MNPQAVRASAAEEAGCRLREAETALQEMLAVDRARTVELEAARVALSQREADAHTLQQAQVRVPDR